MVQKLVTKPLYCGHLWSDLMVGRERKWTQMDTESIGHHPLAVLQVPQNPVHEVWHSISCSYKGTS